MKGIFKILPSFLFEILLLVIYLILVNNYIGNVKTTINADGKGYYEYLPSIFIHDDFNRKGTTAKSHPELYRRLAIHLDYKDKKLIKYTYGTALLQAPFFGYAYLTTPLEGNDKDGYQPPFQKAIFHAALFYLFLSLLLLRKILEGYEVRWSIIALVQLLLALGTTLTHYVNMDAAYSHIYSMFAITGFLCFASSYFRRPQSRNAALMLIFLGLIIIIRPVNTLILLFLPFLAGSWPAFKNGILTFLQDKKGLLGGLVMAAAMISVQFFLWHQQVGEYFLYSYSGEGFNFASPEIFNILFSYQKGLFVYTPILFIALSSIAWLIIKRRYYQAFSWLLFFGGITYVFSSWWAWHYGCSYGLRAYIEYYPIFFIPFAVMLDRMKSKIKYILIAFSLLTIPLNIIQTYQYKEFILHWLEMDQKMYWDIFLKTDYKYKGFYFKNRYVNDKYVLAKEFKFDEIKGAPFKHLKAVKIDGSEVPMLEEVRIVRVKFESDFKADSDSKLVFRIDGKQKGQHYYWNEKPLVQFNEEGLDKWQMGFYDYKLRPMPAETEKLIGLEVMSENFVSPIKHVSIQFWTEKP